MSKDSQEQGGDGSGSVFTRLKSFFCGLFSARSVSPTDAPPLVAVAGAVSAVVKASPPPEADLVIGFDLGTSCSKVVIGDHGWLGKSYAVVFDPEEMSIERHLLPTVFFDGEAECTLQSDDCGEPRHNLKLRLMQSVDKGPDEEPDDIQEATESLAIYFALVLRQTVRWFSEEYGADYKGHLPCWHLNIGFPRKNVEGPLLAAYQRAARAAVRMAASQEPINRIRAQRILRDADTLPFHECLVHPDRIHFYPEIAAQLAGYSKSPYRRIGNLLLVDVGAGTLDISTLIFHEHDQTDVCSFHFCAVEPRGAFRLFEYRCMALQSDWPNQTISPERYLASGFSSLPETVQEHLSPDVTVDGSMRAVFDKTTQEFAEECRHACFSRLVQFRKSQRDAHDSPAFDPWPGKLPFILSGGGSRIKFYSDALRKPLEQQLAQNFTRWDVDPYRRGALGQGLEMIKFPLPNDFDLNPLLVDDFDRLSVAHGLAYGVDDLPDITGTIQSDGPI